MEQRTAVFLAGGKARRANGANKANFLKGEKTLLEHFQEKFSEYQIWIAGPIKRFPKETTPVLEDRYMAGPLGAIVGAMERISVEWILFAACDMPNLSGRMADVLYEHREGYGVCFENLKMQPLFVLLSRESLPFLKKQMEEGEWSLKVCFERMKIKILKAEDYGFSEKDFENWNAEHEERKDFP